MSVHEDEAGVDYEDVRYEVSDGVAVLTLDAPERRNGMRVGMLVDLLRILDRADRDPRCGP